MKEQDLSHMERLYMALADKTRLRLLGLMREEEVCVGSFTELLGDSQPKISRHLAYLRNAGIVQARRSGKWIHYSIRWPDDDGGRDLLLAALNWLSKGQAAKSDKRNSLVKPKRQSSPKHEGLPLKEDTSVQAYMIEGSDLSEEPAHNELEEFLL